MLTRKEALALCLRLPDAYEDYPFDDMNWTVMRHRSNRKSFAYIFQREGRIWINVKAEPSWGDFWRSTFRAVIPAYHMNKLHWVSIILDGSMSEAEIFRLIEDSYDLTAPKRRAKAAQDWDT